MNLTSSTPQAAAVLIFLLWEHNGQLESSKTWPFEATSVSVKKVKLNGGIEFILNQF